MGNKTFFFLRKHDTSYLSDGNGSLKTYKMLWFFQWVFFSFQFERNSSCWLINEKEIIMGINKRKTKKTMKTKAK
jgi:hypothetical protein